MKQGARFQAAIILLDKILGVTTPADQVITSYFRHNRYIGSGDRRTISEIVFQILRRYEELSWYISTVLQGSTHKGNTNKARLLVLIYAHKIQNLTVQDIQALFHFKSPEDKYGPPPLTTLEHMFLKESEKLTPDQMPVHARYNVPLWALPHLKMVFGEYIEEALPTLNQPAPLDLRVNTLKAARENVLAKLQEEGFNALPTPLSPIGIRLSERHPLANHPLWKDGHIEIQDEGSQLLALLADARPDMAVLDFCAGAGGKTLVMAATMHNKGRIVATDVALWRLNRSRERLRRAGVYNVEFRSLEDAQSGKWLKRQNQRFDRVLIDSPCSGSGTWRRNPDLKMRFKEEDLAELLIKQAHILERASPLVKPGGRLVYATCSLFKEENQTQVENFLTHHPDFHLIPLTDIWTSVLKSPCPTNNTMLQLTPYEHHVDGFFVAVMERKK
ncbi:MAG: RsmB/NOP family class I SAM-dependent RNA methyltransferase [Alphaproteobacteria bacterium]|nr:RsmB/NOP family class I SAM-dependent RNA methyltransferase [Alphaproteobacteria bacterium]